jgi:hypothetical protein
MIPTTADAVAASVACASALGLPTENPVVVAEGYSVRVRLDPAPVISRVVTVGRTLRGDPLPWMQREINVARFLAACGARAVPPWRDAGPHVAAGLAVSLWEWVEPAPCQVSPALFGVLLADLHAMLSGYDGDLPLLVGPLTDIATALETQDDSVLHQAADRLLPLALTWPRRPLHGDAHTGNLLGTDDGPRWIDFEDACIGPLEWDLASRTISDEFVDAYPGEVNRVRLEECRDLRRLQILAAILTDDIQDAKLYDEVTTLLRRRLA